MEGRKKRDRQSIEKQRDGERQIDIEVSGKGKKGIRRFMSLLDARSVPGCGDVGRYIHDLFVVLKFP